MSSVKTPKKIAARQDRSSKTLTTLLDQSFFIFAGLASFWLAWLVLREGWATGGWWLVGLFFVVWIIVAYLAPDYFLEATAKPAQFPPQPTAH
jgi:mannose/fructose/N-acetylgalactosamine-specific phosphotransferase system component IID